MEQKSIIKNKVTTSLTKYKIKTKNIQGINGIFPPDYPGTKPSRDETN